MGIFGATIKLSKNFKLRLPMEFVKRQHIKVGDEIWFIDTGKEFIIRPIK